MCLLCFTSSNLWPEHVSHDEEEDSHISRQMFSCRPLEERHFKFLPDLVNVLSGRYIYSVFNELIGNNVSDEIEEKIVV